MERAPASPSAIVLEQFAAHFGERPRLFRAPGRVNLIGEHTDYNDGFVFPMAIERATWVAASPRSDRQVVVRAHDVSQTLRFELDGQRPSPRHAWIDYVEGVARVLEETGARLRGANLLFSSDVPRGAGLSSSAALEISVGHALLSISEAKVDKVQLALAGQKAEHVYVGTRCGIMDQYVSALARAGTALRLDCRSLEAKVVPLRLERHAILVFDSGVKHELATGAYNERRAQCEEAVRLLSQRRPEIRALRDVSPSFLEANAALLPERVRKRARHVVSENARTEEATEALEAGELGRFGELMVASHRSLRDDYEVSCAELDHLVDAACAMSGVLGARMTGGGFGGCTVNLVEQRAVQTVIDQVSRSFEQRFGRRPMALVTGAAEGAGEVVLGAGA